MHANTRSRHDTSRVVPIYFMHEVLSAVIVQLEHLLGGLSLVSYCPSHHEAYVRVGELVPPRLALREL